MNAARHLAGFISVLALIAVMAGSAQTSRAQEAASAPAPADAAAAPAAEAEPPAPAEPAFSQEQLEQMLAPIALYPDALLMQMLMSSTYPLELVEAERWVGKNKSVTGTALDKALEAQDWDPSVKSMTHFPDVLSRMSENLDWTQDLGDAFLGQQTQVLDTIQALRKQAYDAGNLKSGDQQTVTVEQGSQVIQIEPAKPEVVYVPQYNSAAVYGTPPPTTQYYPQANTYTGTDMAVASVLSFGVGMAVGGLIWGGDCDWDDHDVYYGGYGGGHNDVDIDINGDVNIGNRTNIGNGNKRQQWQHNPAHREGVRYRDAGTQQKFANASKRPALSPNSARGYDRGTLGGGAGAGGVGKAPGVGQRPAAAAPKMPNKGGLGGTAKAPGGVGAGSKGPSGVGGKGPAVANKAAPAKRPSSGIGSAGGNRPTTMGGLGGGSATRAASARGAASRGSMGGGGGGMRGGGGGSRGGGGGGGRGGRR